MARTSRILLTAFVIAAMAIGALVYLSVRDRDSTTTAQPDTGEAGQVVRENSHRLNTVPDSTVKRPGFPGGSGYWIPIKGWSVRYA
ncbi:protein-disulfide isomerase, partial [Mycolicibacterium phlei]|nr:protein-disulfide isomerase [Mycolicibacterium phlei]